MSAVDDNGLTPLHLVELVGLAVRTTGGEALGRVTDIFSTGSNDVLVVDDDDREILIPMLEGVIVSVDLDGRAVVVEPPPGLPGIPEPGGE